MRRRKFLIGAGSIVAGSTAAMGSGAFAVTDAEREGGGTVVNDNTANLKLYPNGSDHSSIGGNGELVVDLQDLNGDATTQLDDVFYMANQGGEPVDVGISVSGFPSDVTIEAITVTTDANGSTDGGDVGSDLLGGTRNLADGEAWGIGVTVDVKEQSSSPPLSATGSFTIDAN